MPVIVVLDWEDTLIILDDFVALSTKWHKVLLQWSYLLFLLLLWLRIFGCWLGCNFLACDAALPEDFSNILLSYIEVRKLLVGKISSMLDWISSMASHCCSRDQPLLERVWEHSFFSRSADWFPNTDGSILCFLDGIHHLLALHRCAVQAPCQLIDWSAWRQRSSMHFDFWVCELVGCKSKQLLWIWWIAFTLCGADSLDGFWH